MLPWRLDVEPERFAARTWRRPFWARSPYETTSAPGPRAALAAAATSGGSLGSADCEGVLASFAEPGLVGASQPIVSPETRAMPKTQSGSHRVERLIFEAGCKYSPRPHEAGPKCGSHPRDAGCKYCSHPLVSRSNRV